MQILAMSDIHGRFEMFDPALMPDADAAVIAGDITTRGLRDRKKFMASEQWILSVVDRYPMTFWIPGNHDLLMEPDVYYPIGLARQHRLVSLYHQTVVYRGKSFYGVSLSTAYDMPELASQWAHMTTRMEVEQAAFDTIPPSTNILVSHSPPWLVMDQAGVSKNPNGTCNKRNIGSVALRRHIEMHQPSVVICGHVHGEAGYVRYGGTDIYNVAEEWRLIEVKARDL